MQLVSLEIGVDKRVTAFCSLALSLLAGKFEVFQLFNINVEVDWTLFLFARIKTLFPRKRSAIGAIRLNQLNYRCTFRCLIAVAMRFLAEEGLMQDFQILTLLIEFGISDEVSPLAWAMYK